MQIFAHGLDKGPDLQSLFPLTQFSVAQHSLLLFLSVVGTQWLDKSTGTLGNENHIFNIKIIRTIPIKKISLYLTVKHYYILCI